MIRSTSVRWRRPAWRGSAYIGCQHCIARSILGSSLGGRWHRQVSL